MKVLYFYDLNKNKNFKNTKLKLKFLLVKYLLISVIENSLAGMVMYFWKKTNEEKQVFKQNLEKKMIEVSHT